MPKKVWKNSAYRRAGVDIDMAQSLLDKLKRKLAKARRPEMLAPIGGFGGLFQLDLSKYAKPVLVSSIDGVGTKLLVAMMMEKFDTVGYDIVNHCINDIAVQGAEPLYFLDYFGIGKLRSPLYEEVIAGVAGACAQNNCALLGGETAEMPGLYGDEFDLVGVVTGVVEKDKLITGAGIKPGYTALGLASNGLHTNGYSLARHVLFEIKRYAVDTELRELGGTIGEALLRPHTCYWQAIKAVREAGVGIKGIAHITGGGLFDNVPRILPKNVNVVFSKNLLPVPPIFRLIQEEGGVDEQEMYRVFNMGIGMVWFIRTRDVEKAIEVCAANGYQAAACGKVVKGSRSVIIE